MGNAEKNERALCLVLEHVFTGIASRACCDHGKSASQRENKGGSSMLYQDASKTPRERAEDLLSRLTLREKVGQLNQRLYGFSAYTREGEDISLSQEFTEEVERYSGLGVLYGLYRADPWSQRDYSNGLYGKYMKRAYNLAQKYVVEHSRFGIPMLLSTECPHGHQALDGYLLPVNLGVGAAWNPSLTEEAYRVCGKQLKDLGVHYALISMLDVLRDPRWGRSEECYGEDPFLAASLARSAVKGCQEEGVPVVAKHFCAQGEGTGGVNASAARIGSRELREIHLPAMKACCEEGVAGVMAAYNEIDGMYCHGNKELLQDVLRGELGFTGAVMADGCAIDRLDNLTDSPVASGAMALDAGVDISLWDNGFSHLEEAVEQGLVSEAQVDRAALRVLELKFQLGLFENPYLSEDEPLSFPVEEYPQSLELARQGAVLLKNQGILPLRPQGKRIAVIGPNADDLYHQLGDYSPAMAQGAGATLLKGLRELLGEDSVRYAQGCPICGQEGAAIEEAVALARESDLVILAVGGSSSRFAGASFDINGAAETDGAIMMDCGEGIDCSTLRLPGLQDQLCQAVLETGKPVVAVVIGGRPYAIPELCEAAQGVIYSFYPGPWGGRALAEILLGKVSPSGRLPASLPRSVGQLPCYYNPKSSYRPTHYCDQEDGALYPFGYGLSYTEFAIEDVRFPEEVSLKELEAGARVKVRFVLKNLGDMDAWAVPQLFIHDVQASTVRRVRELKAFDKVFLKSGQGEEWELSLGAAELSLWDPAMRFVVEPGDFALSLEEGGKVYATGTLTVTP